MVAGPATQTTEKARLASPGFLTHQHGLGTTAIFQLYVKGF